MRKLFWQVGRWIRQNWLWYKCSECGGYKVFERIKVHPIYGTVWCGQCFADYVGAEYVNSDTKGAEYMRKIIRMITQ